MRIRSTACLALLILTTTCAVTPSATAQEPEPPTWPREFDLPENGGKLVVYQPQIERWDDFEQLQALVAISLERTGEDAVLGALRIVSTTDTDHQARKVVLRDIQLPQCTFPTLDGDAATAAAAQVREVFPTDPVTVPLDRVLANLDRELVNIRNVEVRNDPPQIFVSRKNAMMTVLDGRPVYQRVEGTEVFQIVNTSAYLFRHGRFEQYYMVFGRGWITTDGLQRGWEPENNLPDTFRDMPTGPQWQGVRSRVPGKLISLGEMPETFVTQPAAELLQFKGEPRLAPVPGTELSYASNSNNDVFVHNATGLYYILISGRWYRTRGIDSPLQFCTSQLPDEFSQIPADHETGRVRPCVPGTPESKEAIIAAHLPRAAKARRDQASATVTYIGAPSFVPIDGTGVEYAVNTSLDIFRVDGQYYGCHDAIWYRASSPEGPFSVSDTVPQQIYSIPVSSPKFRVTYVFVDSATPEEVTFTYYPGYRGTFVAGDTVVYGTGYAHNLPKEHYIHYFRNPKLHVNDHVLALQTFGAGYYYDHLNGGFQRSPEARTHYASNASPVGPQLTWAMAGVNAVPYGATGGEAPAREPGAYRGGAPDVYAGPDGNVYQRDNLSWRMYSAGRRWQPVDWAAAPAYRPATRVGSVEPQAWTRQPATQRGLEHHTFSRDLTAHRYQQYRLNYNANRTQ